MLVQANHLTLLQSAMQELERRDINIVFLCSDGRITCRSTHFKIHSKFLQKILSEIPAGLQEFVIHVPDIPKSHMSHLVSLMSQGSSNFNSSKLSNVDCLSDVINNVLETADILGVKISNYGFDLADEGVENLNNIKKEPSEYCEIECVLIKSENDHGNTDNLNHHILPEAPTVELETSVENKPEKLTTREQQRREAFLERAKFKRNDQQQHQSYSDIMPYEDIEDTNSVSGKPPCPTQAKHNLNMSERKLRKPRKPKKPKLKDNTLLNDQQSGWKSNAARRKKMERKERWTKAEKKERKERKRFKALGLLQDQFIQELPLGPQWVAGPPPYSHGNVGIPSSPKATDSAPVPVFDMGTSLPPHSPPTPPRTQFIPRTTSDSLGNVHQQQKDQQTLSSASAPMFGKSLSLLKEKPKQNATFH